MRCNKETWKLTLIYCKKEINMAKAYIVASLLVTICSLFSNFVFEFNEYKLPYRLSFEWIAFAGGFMNWLLNYFYQSCVLVYVASFYFLYFLLSLNIMNQACWGADVTTVLIQQLDRVFDDEDDRDAAKILRNILIAKKLKKVIDMTYRVIDYHDRVQKLLQFNFCVDFTMSSFLLCMVLFTLKKGIFSALLLHSVLTQLFIYCWMGNRVIVCYETLATSVYCMKWYLMDVKHQKDLNLILLRTQALKGFDGIFKTVSLETFKSVIIVIPLHRQ